MSMSGLLTSRAQLFMSATVCSLLVFPSFIYFVLINPKCSTSCMESSLAIFGLLVGQGSSKDDPILSKRILWMTTLAFAIIISNILLGSVTALLSVKVEDIKIDSFQAAYENGFNLIFRQKSVFSDEFSNPKGDPCLSMLNVYKATNQANGLNKSKRFAKAH